MQVYTQLSNVRVVGAEHNAIHLIFIDGFHANHLLIKNDWFDIFTD